MIAVIAWMAGLFYLPRLFVYHAEASPPEELFRTMERRLLRAIMNPAMIATWIFGLCLVFTPGIVDWSQVCGHGRKLRRCWAMTWFHHWLGKRRKDFEKGTNSVTGRQFRLMNELPTLLMIVIVISVIVRF